MFFDPIHIHIITITTTHHNSRSFIHLHFIISQDRYFSTKWRCSSLSNIANKSFIFRMDKYRDTSRYHLWSCCRYYTVSPIMKSKFYIIEKLIKLLFFCFCLCDCCLVFGTSQCRKFFFIDHSFLQQINKMTL